MTQLRAGWAAADITPHVGIHMGGYLGRTSGATEVSDPLAARALVFAGDVDTMALLTLDLVGLDAGDVDKIRQRVREQSGIRPDAIMVCCSHTHAGPLSFPYRGMGEIDEAYLEKVRRMAATVVGDAVRRLRPAAVSYGKVAVRIGVNRREDLNGRVVIGRNPSGPVADHAHVVRVECDDGVCILFSHACHPNVLGPGNCAISADFVGAAIEYVESRTGAMAMFANGACGDVNPRIKGVREGVTELGAELGAAVVAGAREACPLIGCERLSFRSSILDLPLIDPPPRAHTAAEKLVLKLRMGLMKLGRGDYWSQLALRGQLGWAEQMLALVHSGGERTQRFEVQGLKLGSMVLLGMEGEMFARFQLELEGAAPTQPTILCGYANGCIGYVPTADEYVRGGYEVGAGNYNFRINAGVEAYRIYPSVQMIAPESEQVIVEGARSLLTALCR